MACNLHKQKELDWKYTFSRNGKQFDLCGTESSCSLKLFGNCSGEYQCTAHHTNTTIESNKVNLTVGAKPQPCLKVSSQWLNAGSSVVLNCSVAQSAGLKFFWYKAVPVYSNNSYRYELLPGSISGTAQDSYIIRGQKQTAGYACRAARTKNHALQRNPKFVWSGIDSPQASASVKVSPDSVQHFSRETISLSCEGKSSECRVMRSTATGHSSNCSAWGTMTGSTCIIRNTTRKTAVYWCECGSGFSNAVNITFQRKDIILVSPVQPVTKGEAVTLICRLNDGAFDSNVFFYRNDRLIQNHSKSELSISAASESDEGFYKCECSGNVSTTSWMSVKSAPRHESSSFCGQPIIGLVCGILLISGFVLILLLLFCRHSQSKEDNLLYAEINFISKDTHNNDKGNGSPDDIAETVYSGVKR
ncbi:uncharacterized protein LOC142369071 isoform X2 [Odontesthes bonariensis]|uniref:uncharacterized protein LOC142369071 isoform X2 n=1 Tax=Odontesthes bonariensis TaxID=219752 RepID=UPI003F580FEA